jgi:hypothetical protein
MNSVKADLADAQWTAASEGHLTGPDGTRFVRRSTKTKRRTCDDLVARGVPVVLFYFAGGQLDWHDGPDALAVWQTVRTAVTSQEPKPKGPVEWNAGIWESDEGPSLLLLTGHC